MKFIYLSSLMLICFMCCKEEESSSTDYESLMPPPSMLGWDVRNGDAEFEILEDRIIGTTKMDTRNTFLCTKKRYFDFILEFDVQVDSTINSGVQIRSNSNKDYRDGAVHGYQVEIDPSKRAWSGGIYDESRRGWICDLKNNPEGRKAFKNGQFNSYHIEAVKDEFQVWVNGINTANLRDTLTDAGFIGFQIHSIGKDEDAGKKIVWKGIRIATENLDELRWKDKVTAPLVDRTIIKEE